MSNWLKTAIVTGAMAASAAVTLEAQAADTFIKIDGITGDSAVKSHKGEVSVLSWSWGSSSSAARVGSGAGAGKVSVQDLTLTKPVDGATVALLGNYFSGKHIPKVVLTVDGSRGDGSQAILMTITLTDVLVTSVQVGSGAGAATPTESITLNFKTVSITAPGTGSKANAAGYDAAAAKAQ